MPQSKAAANEGSSANPPAAQLSSEDKDRLVDIWKKAVETQMHFNEMSGKSRQLGLTFVAAALGVAVVMLARGDDFAITIAGWHIHVGVLLVLAAALALWGVRQLDLGVYHRMLRGAVTFGEDFERNYMRHIFHLEKGMTQAISHFSRSDDAYVNKDGEKYAYKGNGKITAEDKIRRFYNQTTFFLILSAILLFSMINFENLRNAIIGSANGAVEIGHELIPAMPTPSTESVTNNPASEAESGATE